MTHSDITLALLFPRRKVNNVTRPCPHSVSTSTSIGASGSLLKGRLISAGHFRLDANGSSQSSGVSNVRGVKGWSLGIVRNGGRRALVIARVQDLLHFPTWFVYDAIHIS